MPLDFNHVVDTNIYLLLTFDFLYNRHYKISRIFCWEDIRSLPIQVGRYLLFSLYISCVNFDIHTGVEKEVFTVTYTLLSNTQQTFSPAKYPFCLPHRQQLPIWYPMQVKWCEKKSILRANTEKAVHRILINTSLLKNQKQQPLNRL